MSYARENGVPLRSITNVPIEIHSGALEYMSPALPYLKCKWLIEFKRFYIIQMRSLRIAVRFMAVVMLLMIQCHTRQYMVTFLVLQSSRLLCLNCLPAVLRMLVICGSPQGAIDWSKGCDPAALLMLNYSL